MHSKLDISVKSHASLEKMGFEALVRAFLERRIRYFFGDHQIAFLPENAPAEKNPQTILVKLKLTDVFLDEELLHDMIERCARTGKCIKAYGAVPGTSPVSVSPQSEKIDLDVACAYSDLQRRYNTQLNLCRPKRTKLFMLFLERFSDLHTWPLKKFLDFCSSKVGVEFILGYGSRVPLTQLTACPLCDSRERFALHADSCHPVSGFLTRESEYYHLCTECNLVYLSPVLPESELWRYYDHFAYETLSQITDLSAHYRELNPTTGSTFFNYEAMQTWYKKLPPRARVLDLGGGIGEFTAYIKLRHRDFIVTLCDYRVDERVERAQNELDIEAISKNFLDEELSPNTYNLITNWEVIEHLPVSKLKNYFKNVGRSLVSGGHYIFSTPDFMSPYARAMDFWAAYPGEHLSVLSRGVLEPLLNDAGFKIVDERHESVTFKAADRWFSYGAEAGANMASRAECDIINDFLKQDGRIKDYQNYLREKNHGSELILCCEKVLPPTDFPSS